MSATVVNANTLSREYLAEDNSAPLLGTSIAFLVLETVVMALMYVSRYLAKGERTNLSMEILMTLTYIVCVSKITIAFCECSQSYHPFCFSFANDTSNSVDTNRWRRTPSHLTSANDYQKCAEAQHCPADRLPADYLAVEIRGVMYAAPDLRAIVEVVPPRYPNNFCSSRDNHGGPSHDSVHQLPSLL